MSRKNLVYRLAALGALLLLAACNPDSASDELSKAEHWQSELQEAGAKVTIGGEVSQPFFTPTGTIVRVNEQDVQIFVYEDEAAAQSEAALVSPSGTAVGTQMMMWMASPHFYRQGNVIALYVGDDDATLAALEHVFGAQFAGNQEAESSDIDSAVSAAALNALAQIGWDISGFTAELRIVDGDYALVGITTADPPGGFSAFMTQVNGQWIVTAHGSAFNPEELSKLGFPETILAEFYGS